MSQVYIPPWFSISVLVHMKKLPEHLEEQFTCRGFPNWQHAIVRCLGLRRVAPRKGGSFSGFRMTYELASAIEDKLLPSQDWLKLVVFDALHENTSENADTACSPSVARPMDALEYAFLRKQKRACELLEAKGPDLLNSYIQNPTDPCEGLMTELIRRTAPNAWDWFGTDQRELMWKRLVNDVYYTRGDPQAKLRRESLISCAQLEGAQMLATVMRKVLNGELPTNAIKYWVEILQPSTNSPTQTSILTASHVREGGE